MSSLTQKRSLQKINKNDFSIQIESQKELQLIKLNTNNNIFEGSVTLSNTGNQTIETSVINLSSSKSADFSWVGNLSHSHTDFEIHVSLDNITFYKLNSISPIITSTIFSLDYKMSFKYHKLKVVNTDASQTITTNLIYSSR